MEAERLEVFKGALREVIANNGFIPDQESFDLVQKIVPWPAVEVCLVDHGGRLLLHYREFTEWPDEWGKISGWYLPGGYMKTGKTMEEWCRIHLKKDGVEADFHFLGTAGVLKWAPGEHPIGFPISILCVCLTTSEVRFREGDEGKFMWTEQTIPTDVPNHTKLQDMFFSWRAGNRKLFHK